ncbi:hypothetical protein [Saccharothrix deserti]|uniref:hypothetical protein n=1 Tax=Saccharothrix deserti TaxID=2593674 RepID=UPI00131EAC2E|nr:hypothetical protein [Saccharothrix deserti]
MGKVKSFVVAGASVIAALLVVATPASAHRESITHGSDEAFTDSTHLVITACDREADGNGVRAEYETWSTTRIFSVGDANGSASGCGSELSENGYEIYRFRVCEANVGCSRWEYTDS